MDWGFDNTYARELKGFYVPQQPAEVPEPALIALNEDLARELNLDPVALRSAEGAAIFAGNAVPDDSTPIAQAYSGHQFGHFSPMLGDGRAVLLGEIVDTRGRRRDIALKGSGRTPFSRGGDGKAVIGPVLREYVVAEAMHALGIPTTRALAAATTGERIAREGLQPGAVLTRVASSHLRVGTFQMVHTRGTANHIRQLADYAMARHYPDLAQGDYFGLLSAVVARQAELIADWTAVGFIHGVMNTDNMTISGETIDYGPCAFMETYDDQAWFSSIDTGGRYRYGNQPQIGAWNLSRFAESLLPILGDDPTAAAEEATIRVKAFLTAYDDARLQRFAAKLGLPDSEPADDALVEDLLELMKAERMDFTLTFRRLAAVLRGQTDSVREHATDLAAYDAWQRRWVSRINEPAATADAMDAVNPLYIPRNHLVEEALTAARNADYAPFKQLLDVVTSPYQESPGKERYAEAATEDFTSRYVTFCGT